MAQAGINFGQDIERNAKYPLDFLGDKNCYHNFTIVTGTFRSDFFFSNYLTLKLRSSSPLSSESDISICKLVSNLSIYSGDNNYDAIKEYFNFL